MKCIFFSDLHIKAAGDSADTLFQKLCSHAKMHEVTHVFLLGDIFDLLIGEHSQYFTKYNDFFKSLISLINHGKKVIFLEGNHDFHVQKSLEKYIETNCTDYKNFKYLTQGELMVFGDKKYYVCHGDEVDFENQAFKRWKKIYTSKEFAFFINNILKFRLIDYLGNRVSQNSKNRGRRTFDKNIMKNKYISGAEKLIKEKGVHGVICGHTHIQENHTFKDGSRYINCGHPLTNTNFLYFDGQQFSFISLKDS